MKARRNPLSTFESFLERIFQAPFNKLFPSRLEPIELGHKLERAMDDNTLLRHDGRFIVPNVYDMYVSIKDHQYLSPNQGMLIKDWQEQLITYARHRQYVLSDNPVLRLHSDTSLKAGQVRIEAAADESAGGHMATQALSAEQLAKLQAQFSQNQQDMVQAQGMPQGAAPTAGNSAPNQHYQGSAANIPPAMPPTPLIPHAQLTITLPQGGQRVYRIEKPVVSIGRQLDNDIIVEDKRVGRYHAQIKFDGQHFTIFDLGSTNGTLINQVPGVRQHALRNGDVFTIGSYDFHYERR